MSKLSINIEQDNLCSVLFHEDDGTITSKKVSYSAMLEMIQACTISETVKQKEDSMISEIFPGDHIISLIQTKHYVDSNTKWYIFLRQPVPVDFNYFDTIYKNVGVPRTIFAIQVHANQVISFKIACVKDMFVTENTKIYAYPFSNVSPSGFVCTGDNYKEINQKVGTFSVHNLISIPEMFFAMPNSEHSYGHNKSGLYYRDLLEQLSDKPFNNDWLEPTNTTYNTFFKSF